MTTSIVSFSHKRGLPEDKTGNGGGFVFDCRAMLNPYWDISLRGCGKCCQCVNVASCQFQFPVEDTWSHRILAIGNIGTGNIHTMAKLNTGRDHLQVAFGCTGGQHRSVYFAERMAERLAGTDGVEIELTHAARKYWKEKTMAKEKCNGEC